MAVRGQEVRRVLRPATSVEECYRTSIDRYYCGRGWVAFHREHLSGVIFWGHIDVDNARELVALLPLRTSALARPHASIVDARLFDGLTPAAFALRAEVLGRLSEVLRAYVTRVAIVHPPGVLGALSMGLHAICAPPYPEQFFLDPVDALRWLGMEAEIPLLAELDELRRHASELMVILRRLRAMLDAEPRLALEDAARGLGSSVRSLQRRFANGGTSFQEERKLASVRIAQRLLVTSGASLDEIAHEAGCSSRQHLRVLFREVVGETPSQWRDRRRTTPT